MRNFLYTFLLVSYAYSSTDEINLKLNDPVFTQKSAKCSRGGVIKTEEITIYGKEFDYHDKGDDHSVTVTGNLLVKYGEFFIIGDNISYDFKEKRGVIENGVGTINGIIAGGEKIFLFEDGSMEIEEAFATPSPTIPPTFEVTTPLISITSKSKAVTKTMVGRLNGVPIIWLPSWGMNLDPKNKSKPPLTYNLVWENYQVPSISGRAKLYDNGALQAYARLEYRFLFLDDRIDRKQERTWYEGIGGAVDVDYKVPDKKMEFKTRNFATYNIWPLNPKANQVGLRYRLQGQYKGTTEDEKVESLVQWDKLSDRFIRKDFGSQASQGWYLKTLENNIGYVKYRSDPVFITLFAQPRLNKYRGFKQSLPSFTAAARPIEFSNSKIYLEQTYNTSYLDYLYAEELRGAVPDFNSARLSAIYNLYRPFNYGAFNITPRVGFDGIFYSNNQTNKTAMQGVGSYGGDASMKFCGNYDTLTHYIKPFLKYNGLTPPTSNNNDHFIFSIDDGYASYNQLIFGLNNEIFLNRFPVDQPTFACNISGMSFFDTASFKDPVAKGDLELIFHYPRMELTGKFGWNFEKSCYDYFHAKYGWTINDYFAFSTEYRDRGQFWWRKDNHESFVLDSHRTIDELTNTPLSNARYCLVSKMQMQLAPLWTFQIENNTGRQNSYTNDLGEEVPGDNQFYVQTKLILSMVLGNSYRLGVSYMVSNSEKDNALGFVYEPFASK
jgi:hypothetical protein